MTFLEFGVSAIADPDRRQRVEWFVQHRGWEVTFKDLAGLATRAKGIYKPAGWSNALSVRIMLESPYKDTAPVSRPDGTWACRYHQEGVQPEARDQLFTNKGLNACLRDRSPIGVLRQISGLSYEVVGAALVVGWESGFFLLEGLVEEEAPTSDVRLGPDVTDDRRFGDPPHEEDLDGRWRQIREVITRQGQAAFRAKLLKVYGSRCAISDCDVPEVLDAAHILPYRGPHTNHHRNGLLLRTDLHALFDLGLLAIDCDTMSVILSPQLQGTQYASFGGRRVSLPEDESARPSREALRRQRAQARL